MQLCAQKLDALYAAANILSIGLDGKASIQLDILEDAYATTHFIRETVSLITNWLDLDDADNFFTLGMDSLQALRVLQNLKQGLCLSTIELNTIIQIFPSRRSPTQSFGSQRNLRSGRFPESKRYLKKGAYFSGSIRV